MSTHSDELQFWRERLQRYLDGDLPKKEAVRFFLEAERRPELQAELDAYRQLFAHLDATALEQPSADFDEAVLAQVPYEKYESAPRLARPVLALGGDAGPALARLIRPLRNGMTAVAVAYVLFLVVSHSFLQRTASQAAGAVGEALGRLAAGTHDVPILSSLVGGLARAYDALMGAVAALGSAWGGGVVTVLFGLVLGVATVGAIGAARRRQEAKRTHA